MPEIWEDKLKVSVTLDLLSRFSVSLQELYTSALSIVAECCKCSEEVKREFYDFAYHGLRAEHNHVVHRVEDLVMAQEKMTDEEKEHFCRLQQLQTNRQRQVDRLEKLWRGLFSPVRIPVIHWKWGFGINCYIFRHFRKKKSQVVSGRLELNTFWAALFCFMTEGLDWHRLQNRTIYHSNNLIVSFSFSKRPKSRLGGFHRKCSTLESC